MGVRQVLASAALVSLGACSAVVPLQEPKLQVVGVELLRGDLLRQELRVRMRVQNPNDRQLPVRSITYEVQLGGEPFAHGESDRDFLVPANGETEFDVSVTANAAAAVLKLVGSGRKLDAVEYRITGKVALSSGLFRNIPFDQKGTLNLK